MQNTPIQSHTYAQPRPEVGASLPSARDLSRVCDNYLRTLAFFRDVVAMHLPYRPRQSKTKPTKRKPIRYDHAEKGKYLRWLHLIESMYRMVRDGRHEEAVAYSLGERLQEFFDAHRWLWPDLCADHDNYITAFQAQQLTAAPGQGA